LTGIGKGGRKEPRVRKGEKNQIPASLSWETPPQFWDLGVKGRDINMWGGREGRLEMGERGRFSKLKSLTVGRKGF